MFKLVLEKAEEPETKLPTSAGSWKKRVPKNIYFRFIDYAKAFDCVDHNKLWKILQEMEYQTTWAAGADNRLIPNRKRSTSGCILSPCLFNLCSEYIMRNAGLEETQAGIKIAGRNINNLRYADDTTLMAESE